MTEERKREAGRSAVADIVLAPNVEVHTLTDTGVFPNNETLPLLIYRGALDTETPDLVTQVQKLFEENQWDGSWIDGMYDFHHYHSTAHEALAICEGQAEVRFGGDYGITRAVSAGDVIVIPAGIAHRGSRPARSSSSGPIRRGRATICATARKASGPRPTRTSPACRCPSPTRSTGPTVRCCNTGAANRPRGENSEFGFRDSKWRDQRGRWMVKVLPLPRVLSTVT